jgi:hydrogenase maturation factor
MCLPETVLLVEAHGDGVERWGVVTREGSSKRVGLAFTPDANVGDLLLVHSGQAFRIVEREAEDAEGGTAEASVTPS